MKLTITQKTTNNFLTDVVEDLKKLEAWPKNILIVGQNKNRALRTAEYIRPMVVGVKRIMIHQLFSTQPLEPIRDTLVLIDNYYGYDYTNLEFKFGQWVDELLKKCEADTNVRIYSFPTHW